MSTSEQAPYESALILPVPEAEALVSPFRIKHDSSAAAGMPAHVTINYPFHPSRQDQPVAVDILKHLFAEHPRFAFSLAATARFPGVLYFKPVPGEPFTNLVRAVAGRFPECPPYGGRVDDATPHLTVAVVENTAALDSIARQLAEASIGRLPIHATATEVWLMDLIAGHWTRRASFALAEQASQNHA